MPPHNKRKKHAKNFNRKVDGSFYQLKKNTNLPLKQPNNEEIRTSNMEVQRGTGLFSGNRARRGRSEEVYEIERLYAKRWVHNLEFYLVQWIDYRELTWEPAKNLPWKMKIDFELETIDFVWLYQPTRGRRCPKQPMRRSQRVVQRV
ncbi:hypothetical protein F441_06062 [Phytophthora nicotianae CJ01A1]|uniref:Chromo domain-containing protein n=3 Tax=Phytophthora nicotianae TaxID=4792 RepID=W2XBG8_PHYNI|nr:hypothetical protein F441_06062 [Phytophthora nicotianae CJ01A1]